MCPCTAHVPVLSIISDSSSMLTNWTLDSQNPGIIILLCRNNTQLEFKYQKSKLNLRVAGNKLDRCDKLENILDYRNKCFSSAVTGSIAPLHHTNWIEAMDDSINTFMKIKS